MSAPTKPRGGSDSHLTKLKLLSPDQHEAIWQWRSELEADKPLTNAQMRLRLAKQFSIRLSRDGQLSEFWSWYSARQDLQQTNDLIETFEEFTRVKNPDWSADKVRDTAIQFFIANSVAKKDADQFATVVTLDQRERHGKTKASQKDRQLDQADRKIKLLEQKAAAFDKAKDVIASEMSPEQQRLALKEILK